jgi:P-type Cu2+ transporter
MTRHPTVTHPTEHDAVESARPDHGEHGNGMTTAEATSHGKHEAGHSDHAGHAGGGHHDHAEMFRRLFWWSLLLTVPIVATSHMVMDWFGYSLDFPGLELVGPGLGSILFFWAGWPFLAGGWGEARSRQPGMMLLIAMAISVAYGASLATSLGWFDLEFWWELAALITIMLLGHWQEMKALGQARSALAALAELLPDDAERVGPDGEVETVSLEDLRAGDVVLVRPGGRVPADGTIIDGEGELDESMVTGESRPVGKGPGDRVVAGTVVTDSAVRVRVEAVGEETALAGIQRLVAEAQASGSRAQALADRFAALLFYVAAGAGVITFAAWSLAGDVDASVVRTVTVLVIACPHALGLAIPLVISLSTSLAARSGILVRDRVALESMRTIDAVLFDKTGTLTKGEHAVTGVLGVGLDDTDVLRLAGGVEADSEHPLARAIVAAAKERGNVAGATAFRSITGRGVEATIDGQRYAVGGPALLRERQLTEPDDLQRRVEEWKARGAAVLYLVRGDEIAGALALEDQIRPEAKEAVTQLRRLGKRVVMITGDARNVAETVGRELGVDEVMAEVLPEDKDAKVTELQGRGLSVAMVGDGVNDAAALATADLGIAMGTGTDVAIEASDLTLVGGDLRGAADAIRLARRTLRTIKGNLFWAFAYNVAALPLAAAGRLNPLLAGAAMAFSSAFVVSNSLRLRRFDNVRA